MMYLGGKSRLAKRIGAAILENTNQRGQYIEPMIGGGLCSLSWHRTSKSHSAATSKRT